MACLLKHFQFGPEYSVVSEYGGDVSGDIAAVTPAWCRSDVCIAELRAPVQDAKLSQLPAAFTCFGQQSCVSPAQPPCQSTIVSAEGSDTAASTAANHVAVTPTQA